MGANNRPINPVVVEEHFKANGCVLLTPYVNSHTRLKYICSCGTEREINYTKFKSQKHGCRVCAGLERYTDEFVEQRMLESNLVKLSKYNGSNKKLKYLCSTCGYKGTTTFSGVLRGSGCWKCGQELTGEKQKLNIEEVKQQFIEGGCIPLFDEYKNGHTPLKYQCACGEVSQIAFFDFRAGKRCWSCKVDRTNATMHKNGTQSCSLQQKYLNEVLGGELNYPIGSATLDVAFLESKIYLEYDGSGHNLSVRLGHVSEESFQEKEKRRNYKMWKSGWKSIRVISSTDKLPSDDVLLSMKAFAFNVLLERSWIEFDIDNGTYRISVGSFKYEFGETKRMRLDSVSAPLLSHFSSLETMWGQE